MFQRKQCLLGRKHIFFLELIIELRKQMLLHHPKCILSNVTGSPGMFCNIKYKDCLAFIVTNTSALFIGLSKQTQLQARREFIPKRKRPLAETSDDASVNRVGVNEALRILNNVPQGHRLDV